MLFKDSDLVLRLEDERSLLVKDGALQYALQQPFALEFNEGRVLSTEFIPSHPNVNYSLGSLDDNLLFSSGVILPTYDGDTPEPPAKPNDPPVEIITPPLPAIPIPPAPTFPFLINPLLSLGALATGVVLAATSNSSDSASGSTSTPAPPANTLAPLLTLGSGLADGATAAEATASTGVAILKASSGSSVVVTFIDSSSNTLIKILTGTGADQAIVLAASDIGTGAGQMHDGLISVVAVATDTAHAPSSPAATSFILDTLAPVLQSLTLTSSNIASNNNPATPLKPGDVITLTASYSDSVIGSPTAPTLSIGSKTGIILSPVVTSGNRRSWSYTISNTGTPDSGSVQIEGGNFLTGLADSAGNQATTPADGVLPTISGSFSADSSTPNHPILSLGSGVIGGATAAEATQASGVLLLSAESGSSVVLSFSDGTRTLSKTILSTGSNQPILLTDSDIGPGANQLHDGSISVTAVATNAAGTRSAPGQIVFTLDTTAPV
ncbi:MAG: hypothetical protein ORN28_08680, partial [Rhodoferax sp.]|nr:hypothetical protein [Rhodoferax sp.]